MAGDPAPGPHAHSSIGPREGPRAEAEAGVLPPRGGSTRSHPLLTAEALILTCHPPTGAGGRGSPAAETRVREEGDRSRESERNQQPGQPCTPARAGPRHAYFRACLVQEPGATVAGRKWGSFPVRLLLAGLEAKV